LFDEPLGLLFHDFKVGYEEWNVPTKKWIYLFTQKLITNKSKPLIFGLLTRRKTLAFRLPFLV